MQIYPAVDIRGGSVARVLEGEDARDTFYGSDPLAQAKEFMRQGARWLHVVDMDRALQTGRDNSAAIAAITALKDVKVQLGGNICSDAWVRDAATTGASRIVLGTAAALMPDLFRTLVHRAGAKRCGLAIDTRNGAVVLRGSRDAPTRKVEDLVLLARDEGVHTIIYRDIERDGTVQGANVGGAGRVVALGVDVIVAGGVAGLSDIHAAQSAGLAGVIVGRALYEGRFSLREALQCCL